MAVHVLTILSTLCNMHISTVDIRTLTLEAAT